MPRSMPLLLPAVGQHCLRGVGGVADNMRGDGQDGDCFWKIASERARSAVDSSVLRDWFSIWIRPISLFIRLFSSRTSNKTK